MAEVGLRPRRHHAAHVQVCHVEFFSEERFEQRAFGAPPTDAIAHTHTLGPAFGIHGAWRNVRLFIRL